VGRCFDRKLSSARPGLVALALTLAAQPALGISFLTFDARSMSMGGTGVVTARSHNASLFNPGLLTRHEPHRRDRVSMHAYAGARLLDRDNFLDSAENFADRYEDVSLDDLVSDNFDLEAGTFETGAELRSATDQLRTLQTDLNYLSDKPLRVSASYGASFNYPTQNWAFGGYHRQFLVMGSAVRISDQDNANINRVTSTIDRFADVFDDVARLEELSRAESLTVEEVVNGADRLWNSVRALDVYLDFDQISDDASNGGLRGRGLTDYLREPIPREFSSTIETQGAEVREEAISVARKFPLTSDSRIHVGVNLKQVNFTTIHFEQRIDDFALSAYELDEFRRDHTRFNMDAGMVYSHDSPWEWGVVVRNLVPQNFYTVEGDRIDVRPLVRAGVGYRTRPLRLTLDVDVTKNEPLGFDPDKQYLSMGAEWFIWRNTALRAGLRSNMVDGETLPSAGFGFGTHRGHFDLALAKSANGDEWGLSLQAGLSFP